MRPWSASGIWYASRPTPDPREEFPPVPRPLRIAIGGIHIESSTFSPHLSTADDFEVTRGDALLARYDWLSPTQPWAADVEWIPLVHARALPGGAVDRATYEVWATELVEKLGAAGPLD